MSFDLDQKSKWERIIRPAIEDEPIHGLELKAIRVDVRQSGDSILTDIVDGIANSQMVLADISVAQRWRPLLTPWTTNYTRNGNVMYEVGLAVACRQPIEVLLIRDDSENLLFDVSSIPVLRYNPADIAESTTRLRSALSDRFRERTLIKDLRVTALSDSLGQQELSIVLAVRGLETFFWPGGSLPAAVAMGLPRLLEKRIVRLHSPGSGTAPHVYTWTTLGRAVAEHLGSTNP